MLSEDSYLLEGLQSADKTKTHHKAKLQNTPTFTRNGSYCHVCLLFVIKIKTCTVYTTVSRYQRTNRPIPIIGVSLIITTDDASCVFWMKSRTMESLRADTTARRCCRGWSVRYVRRACLWLQDVSENVHVGEIEKRHFGSCKCSRLFIIAFKMSLVRHR